MRFIIMHRTDARWERGDVPGPELIERVGTVIGEMVKASVFVAGEGLRSSALGVRVRASRGKASAEKGPFRASGPVPSGFVLLRTHSLEEATHWATRLAEILGESEVEVRPVTEAWEIGLAPKPAGLSTTRYMALHKSPAAERGEPLGDAQAAALAQLREEMRAAGVLIDEISLLPSGKGARFQRAGSGFNVTDGPFTEAKELIAGYALLDVPSRTEAIAWSNRYALAVDSDELDLREVAQS